MDKYVIITGANGGIGKALCEIYNKHNYFVIGLDQSYEADNVTKEFANINVDLFNFVKKEKYRSSIFKKIEFIIGRSDSELIIINNAAEQILRFIEDVESSDLEKSFTVNTMAPLILVKNYIDKLKECNGHVINISSIHAKLTKPEFICYAASKAALDSITRSLALEISKFGISVNSVSPAAISTKMLKEGFKNKPEKLRELENYHPSKSIGSPEDVAIFIKSITDHKGGFLTGAVLDYNGGISGRLFDPS